MAGLTPDGLVIKSVAEIRSEIGVALQGAPGFGPGVNLDFDGPNGQMIGAFAIQLGDAWEALGQTHDSRNPDAAEGVNLDVVTSSVGVTRLPATKSQVLLTLAGDPFTVLPAGRIVRIPNGARFIISLEITLDVGGDAVDVLALAEFAGPVTGIAGAVDEIVTAVAGWDTATNPADVIAGRDREEDSALRPRRERSLQIVGAGPDQAIRSNVEESGDLAVQAVIVISNRETAPVDALGIPIHAFRTVVWPAPADPTLIARAIYESMPSGIRPEGSTTVIITDSQGKSQSVQYSVASEFVLHLEAIITKTSLYPADGDQLVEDALMLAYAGQNALDVIVQPPLQPGDDVLILDGTCEIAKKVSGVAVIPGITAIELRAKFGGAPGPGDVVNLAVELDEIATLARVNITVTS